MTIKKITTHKVGRDFAKSGSVLLEQTPETVLLFKPEIHSGGVRGYLVRFKKEHGKEWMNLTQEQFEKITLLPKQKIEIELNTESLGRLTQAVMAHAQIIEQGIKNGTKEYVVAEKDKVVIVDDQTKRDIFQKLLEKGYTPEFWKLLEESEPELATRLSAGHLYSEKQKIVTELADRLTRQYPEVRGVDSWQSWIYENNWLFGINYIRAVERVKINIAGSMPDFIFLTPDSFADVLEIKLPEEDVIVADPSHVGAYKWCPKTNEAIGQVVAYLGDIDRTQSELQREILRVYSVNVSFVKPRGFILIGKKDGWDKFKLEAFRRLNYSMHGIEVITYTDLLQRGKDIADMYKGGTP
jgi:hypothetical protein